VSLAASATRVDASVAVSIRGLSKIYGPTQVLDDVSFDLFGGEIVGLLGENGAGKSTLIKILAGVVEATDGAVHVGGVELSRHAQPAAAREAGLVFIHQDPALFTEMSVEENLGITSGYPRRRGVIDWKALRGETRQLLSRMSIPAQPTDLVGNLVGAVRTSVAIAIAMGKESKVVFLDEPTATLSAVETQRLFAGVRRIREEGGTVVLVSHRIDEIMDLCDRVVVLRDGRLVADQPLAGTSKTALIEHIVGREVHELELTATDLGDVVLSADRVVFRGQAPVNLTLRAGEILGLVGQVSAGHEEFAAGLFGMTPLESGSLTLRGAPYRPRSVSDAIASGVGYVPGNRNADGLVPGLSASENLFLHADAGDPSPGSRAEKRAAGRLIDEFRVKPAAPDLEITAFSGGNAQKVLLARWLRRKPDVMILVEPTAGVDVGARSSIYELIGEMSRRGTAFLIVSSDFEEVATLANRAIVFRRGADHAELAGPLTTPSITAAALS
jgi:ribose transport system ATP-binding protein